MKIEQRDALIATLKLRFEQNMHRHAGVDWADVHDRLLGNRDKLEALDAMEKSGGEPDVIGAADAAGAYLFCDCAAESPTGRRSLCYDREALNSRKQNKPRGNAIDMAADMGVALLTEAEYRQLQQVGKFDTRRHPVGWQLRRTSENSVAPCSATGGTARSSSITTAPSRTTQREASGPW